MPDGTVLAAGRYAGLAAKRWRAHDRLLAACAQRGVHIKWFGTPAPKGFTSVWQHWRYFGEEQSVPNAQRILAGLCDLRLPLTLSEDDCVAIAAVIREALTPNAALQASGALRRPAMGRKNSV